MPKRASTKESLSLAFELLKRIPRSHKITASELRTQLENAGISRDIRTIHRNLEMLCEHFDVVKDDRSKPYGYSWKSNANGFAVPSLSPHESLLLNLAEDYLRNLLPTNVMASMNAFFSEARHNLHPSPNNEKEREWLKKVRFVSENQPLLPPKVDSDVFKNISEALFHNRWLVVEYFNAKEAHRRAEVMPLGLAQQGSRLYLVCRYKGYDNERSLAIHRILKAKVSTFNFERPAGFNLGKYDADGRFGFGEGEKCQLEFCIGKQAGFHLLETPLTENQEVKEFEEHYHIFAVVIDSLQLDRWLRSFGNDVWEINKRVVEEL